MGDTMGFIEGFEFGWKAWAWNHGREELAGHYALAGYDAAALYNDHGGGRRPTAGMANDYALSWVEAGMPTSERGLRSWLGISMTAGFGVKDGA